MKKETLSERIVFLLSQIPKGRVATYGQIAKMAGNARAARLVAWLLNSSSKSKNLPWHRVLNSKGHISLPWEGHGKKQQALLKKEGVEFLSKGKLSLSKFQWQP